MKLFKILVALLLVLSMCASIVACADNNTNKPNDNPPAGEDDKTPGEDDKTPGEDDKTPGEDDKTPGEDDKTPGEDDKTPGEDDKPEVYPPEDADYYVPSLNAFESGVEYDWDVDNVAMDFTDSQLGLIVVEKEGLADLNDDNGFYDYAAKGAGNGQFVFSGFTSTVNAEYFTAGYTYSIAFSYYAKTVGEAKIDFVAVTADGTRVILDSFITEEGAGNVNFDYKVAEGDTAIAIVADTDVEFYIGIMTIKLSKIGLTMNAMKSEEGYKWDMSQYAMYAYDSATKSVTDTLAGSLVKIGDITNTTAKEALLAQGYSADDYAFHVNKTNGAAAIGDFLDPEFFVKYYKYELSFTMWSAEAGGCLIAIDDTSSNHGFGTTVTTNGFGTTTHTYEVGAMGDRIVIWYATQPEVYLVDVTIKSLYVDMTELEVFKGVADFEPADGFYDFTMSDLEEGKFFTFNDDCMPNVRPGTKWISINDLPSNHEDPKYAELKAVLTEENGFGDYAFQYSILHFACLNDILEPQATYKITMRVYCEETPNVGWFYLLPMTGASDTWYGYQVNMAEKDSVKEIVAVDGMANVYDFVFTVKLSEAAEAANTFLFYPVGAPTLPLYVSGISMKKIG